MAKLTIFRNVGQRSMSRSQGDRLWCHLKGFISWVYMQHIKSLSLMVQKLWPRLNYCILIVQSLSQGILYTCKLGPWPPTLKFYNMHVFLASYKSKMAHHLVGIPWQTLLMQSRYWLPCSSYMYCPEARTIFIGSLLKNSLQDSLQSERGEMNRTLYTKIFCYVNLDL